MSRTVVVTGASGSMGAAAVRSLASDGWRVIMACRNMAKGEAVRQSILTDVPGADIALMKLDLSSLASVREFCAALEEERIDALFNNAGIISRGYSLTADGFENTLQTNYIGPYILTRAIAGKMSPGGVIVNMVSLTTRYGKVGRDIFERSEKQFSQLGTYSDTKLALLLFSIALARRYPALKVSVADPGIVNSNMISMGRWFDPLADVLFRPFCRKPEKGVAPALKAISQATERASQCVELFSANGHRPLAKRYLNHPDIDWLWDETARLSH